MPIEAHKASGETKLVIERGDKLVNTLPGKGRNIRTDKQVNKTYSVYSVI